jgi:nitroreductase
MEDFRDVVKRSRSYRRFYENKPITVEELEYMVDCARMTPSAQNLQPLRYIIVTDTDREKVFPHCRWASYLKDWDGPDYSACCCVEKYGGLHAGSC